MTFTVDWTARQPVAGKRGVTPADTPAILQGLGLEPDTWCELVRDFGTCYSFGSWSPRAIDQARTRGRQAIPTVKVRCPPFPLPTSSDMSSNISSWIFWVIIKKQKL